MRCLCCCVTAARLRSMEVLSPTGCGGGKHCTLTLMLLCNQSDLFIIIPIRWAQLLPCFRAAHMPLLYDVDAVWDMRPWRPGFVMIGCRWVFGARMTMTASDIAPLYVCMCACGYCVLVPLHVSFVDVYIIHHCAAHADTTILLATHARHDQKSRHAPSPNG